MKIINDYDLAWKKDIWQAENKRRDRMGNMIQKQFEMILYSTDNEDVTVNAIVKDVNFMAFVIQLTLISTVLSPKTYVSFFIN